MDPQNHINILVRRLISVFALADEWIDRWQSETPGSKLYNLQHSVLSQMINALPELNISNADVNDVSENYESNAVDLPSFILSTRANETPRKMRKVLREHLGELLWLLDQQEQPRHSSTLNRGEDTGTVELAAKTYKVMSACVQQLGSLPKPVEDFSSESQRQSYPG